MARSRRTQAPPLALEDLDRGELIALVRRTNPFSVAPRDLWRVRWDALSARASSLDQIALAAAEAWEAANDRLPVCDPKDLRAYQARRSESERAWAAYRAARDKADRAHAAADRAYAALDLTG